MQASQAQILPCSTTMAVVEAQGQMVVKPDHVYVIAPNRGHGHLSRCAASDCSDRATRAPYADRCLPTVSGGRSGRPVGRNRALGHGHGHVGSPGVARDIPRGSPVPGAGQIRCAPRRHAAQVLSAGQLPKAFLQDARISRMRRAIASIARSTAQANSAATDLSRILMQLRAGRGHDISQYLKCTIVRRLSDVNASWRPGATMRSRVGVFQLRSGVFHSSRSPDEYLDQDGAAHVPVR